MSPGATRTRGPAPPQKPEPSVQARLLCKTGRNAGLSFTIASERPVVVGRTQSAGLIVPDTLVSREHARIGFEAGHFVLENLSRTHGTLLNGTSIQREPLEHLDVIGFGPDSEFIFCLQRPSEDTEPEVPIRRVLLVPTGETGASVELPPGASTIGRAPDNSVVLDLKAVSSQHARFEVGPGRVEVRDLGSANGTTVNGRRVADRARLHDGDTVVLGKVAGYVVQIEREAAPAQPPPPPAGYRLRSEEDGSVLPVPCSPGHYLVGREASCQLVLENKKSVSRRHAELQVDDAGRLHIRDLASGNGTSVNGIKVRESPLQLGDRLQIGLVPFVVEASS